MLNGQVTRFVGNFYEKKGSQVTKYYYAGAQRIAVRQGGTLSYLFGDHLGSTSVVTDPSGARRARTLYKPWGAVRYQSGTLPTEYTFTGQYSHVDDFGLMYYVARWYDPALGRFAQADTVVPGIYPMAFDRYAYVFNSPLNFTDPSGHVACELLGDAADVRACQEAKFSGEGFNDYMATLKYPDVKPISEWTISQEGIDFIKSQEGFYETMYNDGCTPSDKDCFYDRTGKGVGHCTIGYGHLIHSGPCDGRREENDFLNGVTPDQAEALLVKDIATAEKQLKLGVEYHNITTPLTQHQYDALVSLIMNWGERPFFYDITPTPKNPYAGKKLALLKAGDYYGLALHIQLGPVTSNGVEMPGLVKRRQAEMEMFLTIAGY